MRDRRLMLLLGRVYADQRVAAFLLDLLNRFQACGVSPKEVNLPMSRDEIGNYLGITLETVSRCLTRLKNASAIAVNDRVIQIISPAALEEAARCSRSSCPSRVINSAKGMIAADREGDRLGSAVTCVPS